jgi:NADH-quinone oxidoreductase chain G
MKIKLNNNNLEVSSDLTIIQLCTTQGILIPKFCFHELLSLSGNCRMCLVKVSNSQKPVVACATNIIDGIEINTQNNLVMKMREDVLEFLLINHPLDCPICDQGGECDLQDQLLFYGSDSGRFKENKRTVVDKNLGSYMSTIMTRCIHCTRCIRFSNEISGVPFIGTSGRGLETEITNYISSNNINSPISGNLIDICPVGAITSKSYAFVSRPWELTKTESIDIFDSLGSSIRIDSRGSNIIRVLPKYNSKINDEWCTDKVRFNYDSLKYLRLTIPMVKINNFFHSTTWENSFRFIQHFYILSSLKSRSNYFFDLIQTNLLDIESQDYIKQISNYLSGFKRCIDSSQVDINNDYTFRTNIKNINTSSSTLVIGVNLEHSSPILNLNLRRLVNSSVTQVMYLGPTCNLNYTFKHIGISNKSIYKLNTGSSLSLFYFSQISKIDVIKNQLANNPFKYLVNSTINSLHNFGSDYGSYNTRLTHSKIHKMLLNYNISSTLQMRNLNSSIFSIFQGSQGNSLINYYSLVLPSNTYTESNSYYINTTGLLQQTRTAVPLIGLSKINSDVLSNLIYFFGSKPKLNFNYKLYMNQYIWSKIAQSKPFKFPLFDTHFTYRVISYNYYKSDIVTSNSKIIHNV